MALSLCNVQVNAQGQELADHGTVLFPVACYRDDLSRQDVPWHWHDEWEAGVIEQGSATLRVGELSYPLRAGDGLFLNASALHSVQDLDRSHCLLRAVVFHPRLVSGGEDSIFRRRYVRPILSNAELRAVPLSPGVPWQQEALSCISEAWEACSHEPAGYEFRVRAALSRLIFLLGERCPAQAVPPTPGALRAEQRVKTMLAYLQDHCADELTVADIARSAAVSESECMRCFRAVLDATPIQFLRRFRVRRAAELLETTALSVADVGALCGFREMSYFSKTFREAHGCTPREYRQNKITR